MTGKNAAIIGTVASILFASVGARADEPAASPAPAPKTAAAPEGGTDHDGVVGHIGATVFPVQGFAPIPGGMGAVLPQAPVVGVRYWLMQNLGIDGGVGIGWFTGSAPSPFGLAFHVGVPLALAAGKHFTFVVVPEADLAFAHENIPAPGMPNSTADSFLFDLGGRVGAEIHFGFMGIPQLSLQGSLGLFFTHSEAKASAAGAPAVTAYQNNLATTVGPHPWGIFADNIQATYYF
jgi:hypothetical protein